MTTVFTSIPELSDYSVTAEIERHGTVASCLVKSGALGRTCLAEWVDAGDTSAELFSRVRRDWKSNIFQQPAGSLKQHDFHDSGGKLTRVIDVPRGQSLKQQIFAHRFNVDLVLATAISLTKCLEDWHRMSRIHGWLCGDCVFRDARNQIELRDVSVFNLHTQQDFLALPVDDLVFLSPESSGVLPRTISPASDLYSVGAIVFGMLSERPPIEASNASDFFDCQLCLEPPRLRELGLPIPPALDDVVARLLHRDPRDRYETAGALLCDLHRIQDALNTPQADTSFAIGTLDIRLALTQASLVGRDDELETVQEAISDSQSGRPRLQVITGCDVSSRRKFVDEIALRAKARDMFVFRGSASSTTTPKPLQSLETVLSSMVTFCQSEPDLATRLAKATNGHAETLRELMPSLSSIWLSDRDCTGPEAYGGQRVAIALAELFAALAKEPRGVAILFDDLDIADELTQTVMRSITSRMMQCDGNRMLGVVTGNSPTLQNLAEHGSLIQLGPLSPDAIDLHLHSTAGRLSDLISRSIVDVARGSATMASAILRRMIDTKVVTPSHQGWISDERLVDALRGDESIADLLERQVTALSPDSLSLLSVAAVVGQQFKLEMLADVAGASYAQVLEVATDALSRNLLWRETRPGWFCFANDQIHKQLREQLDLAERRRIHLQAVAYLQHHDPANVFELALHYDAAGKGDLALSTSLQAACVARQRFSLTVAQDQLEIAKRWVAGSDRQTGLEISEGLGTIHLLAGRYAQAAEYFYEALRLADQPLDMARIQQQIGELAFKRGRFAEAAKQYEQALTVTGIRVPNNFFTMLCGLAAQSAFQFIHTYLPANWIALQSSPSELDCLRLQLLSRLSHVYWFSRHKLWTLGNHLRSLNEAERFAPSATLAAVYSEHGPVMSLLRWFRRANRYVERSLAIRKRLGDVWGQGQSLHYHSVVMLAECRYQDAITTSKQAVKLLRQTGDVWEMNMARYQAANALYRIGRLSEAAEAASQMYESGRQIGDLQATGISLDVWARTSPHTLSLELVADEAARVRPDAQSHAQTQLAYAVALLHHDRIDEAIGVLDDAIGRCQSAGHLNTYISPCHAWLGTALRRRLEATDCRDGRRFQQRSGNARSVLLRAARIAKGFPGDQAHTLRELAILETILGNVPRAVRYLTKSLSSAVACNQSIEELESLRILQTLHSREADLIGPFPITMERRLEKLSDLHPPAATKQTTSGLGSTNLSLADRFVTVLKSGRRIAQALSPDLVYAEASESARRLLRGQHVDVVTIHKNVDELVFKPWSNPQSDPIGPSRIDASEKLLQLAVQSGQSVCLVRDAEVLADGSGSAIAAPIAFRGEPAAVILVTHNELEDLFGKDEQRIADFVTTLAGAALENADGFLRLQQINDTLEQRVLERTQSAEERARQLSKSNEQLRETEERLRKAIVQANAASEAKSRFLATMSHEIRTPLNGILGMTRLAQQTSIDQRQSGYLETVEESGQSLLTLINDLLDFSKLEANKMELERIPVDFERLAGEVSRLMAASAWQKGVELVCDVDPKLPRTILGDPSRLRQIIMNLLGNAVKFTEQGYVALIIRTCQDSRGLDQVSILVQDTGIGIPLDQQQKIFESFSQADSSTTRRYGGTGLGLAICRELTERMQGTIELDSHEGVGSVFTVKLPFETDSEQPQPESRTLPVARRVAVIDPLVASQQVIASALKSIGAEVTHWPLESVSGDIDPTNDFFAQHWDLVIFGCDEIEGLANQCAALEIPCLFLLPAPANLALNRGQWSAELRKPVISTDIINAAIGLINRDPQHQFVSCDSTADGPARSATCDAASHLNATSSSLRRASEIGGGDPITRSLEDLIGDDIACELDDVNAATRILVAEDGMINQEVIVGILQMQGYEVVIASDGVEAVQRASKEVFDICLMDVDMPRMDGIEATKMIRKKLADVDGTRLPIIAMTAHSDDQIWETCESAGMNGYLAKPIQPDLLFQTIESFCAK